MYEHHILPLNPPVDADALIDIKPLESIPLICKDGAALTMWLLGRTHTIDAVVITVPPEHIGGDRSKDIHQAFEHMLATLRLCYDPSTDVVRQGDGFISLMTQTECSIPAYEFSMKTIINETHIVNVGNIARVFCQTGNKNIAPIMSLLGEGQFPQVPPHLRFLSIYRALELIFEGNHNAMASRINAEAPCFVGLIQEGRSADGAMAELRNRCAHGRSRGSFIPLSGLLYEEQGIHQIVHIMRRIAADEMNRRYGLNLGVVYSCHRPKSLFEGGSMCAI